ncbi:MAG: hypothetical protein JWM85_2232 [Acidimicrobiaceae bacterium]|nr:hypothetical protein [Acidimicrobiaceae bacterium]
MSSLVVVDLEQLDSQTRLHLTLDFDAVYRGPLTAEMLDHLAGLARARETEAELKLASMLGTPTIGAFR